MSTWLLLDVSNLAHRAFHSMGDLSFQGEPTAVLYGVFRDILQLQELYATSYIAFCFDGGCDRRTRIFPRYKRSRVDANKERSEEEREARRSLRNQIYNLRVKHLPEAGFCNLFYQDGYEADDVIASVCQKSFRKDRTFVIVSNDSDMFQLLSPNVMIYSPIRKKTLTDKWFRDTYKISPSQWADVKAIAGCSSDDVPGIKGIGDILACQFLAGTLRMGRRHLSIIECPEVWERNIKLTRLPMEGVKEFPLVYDDITTENWNQVMLSLGMKSLMQSQSQRVAGKVRQRR